MAVVCVQMPLADLQVAECHLLLTAVLSRGALCAVGAPAAELEERPAHDCAGQAAADFPELVRLRAACSWEWLCSMCAFCAVCHGEAPVQFWPLVASGELGGGRGGGARAAGGASGGACGAQREQHGC